MNADPERRGPTERPADEAGGGASSRRPGGLLLVTGAPRSGTKLLRHLLDQHPSVDMTTNEAEFLPWVIDYCAQGGLERPGGFDRMVEYLRLEEYVAQRVLAGHAPVDFEALRASLRGASAGDVFRAFLECEVGPLRPGSYLGDKSPGFVRHLEKVMAALEEARVIHIVRDPRSQAGSLRRVFGKAPLYTAMAWQRAVREVELAAQRAPDRVLEVRYEDLTARPEETVRGLCGYLGLTFEPAMLEVREELESVPAPGSGALGIRPPRPRRYREHLSPGEIAGVEAICAEGMRRWGYAPESASAGVEPPGRARLEVSRRRGQLGLALRTLRRDGWRHLLRRIRLVRTRRAIERGAW